MRCATSRCGTRADTPGRPPRRGRRGAGPGRAPGAYAADTSPNRPFQAGSAVVNSALTGGATSNRPQKGDGFWVVGGALDGASGLGNSRIRCSRRSAPPEDVARNEGNATRGGVTDGNTRT